MPKESKHIAEAQKQRIKIKQKQSKYAPGKVTLQVLGTGADGAPKAVYLFSDQSRYLFNCGEGTQRLAHEHKMKLAKLEHIFITQNIWRNIGGLPGTALTIQDVGVPQITLHGPPGLDELFMATRRFVIIRDLKIKMADCSDKDTFEDNVIKVTYVPLTRTSDTNGLKTSGNEQNIQVSAEQADAATSTGARRTSRRSSSSSSSCSSASTRNTSNNLLLEEDNTDYYAHERKNRRRRSRSRSRSQSIDSGKRTTPDSVASTSRDLLNDMNKIKGISIAYICRLQPRPGALNLDMCVRHGVPPGPLLGRLKNGEDITLADGRLVKSSDVCEPDDPGPLFIVVDCPSEEYLDTLLANEEFKKHQKYATCDEDVACLVVHFTPKNVFNLPRYRQWMDDFCPSTQHLAINEMNQCMGSVAVHRIQHKLNLLSDDIFPLLASKDTLYDVEMTNGHVNKKFKSDDSKLENVHTIVETEDDNSYCNKVNTMCQYHLRPKGKLDINCEIKVKPDEFTNETMQVENFPTTLAELKEKLTVEKKKLGIREYPKMVFLGTGSCIPNKTRNTSGILLQTRKSQNILVDCGEATYGQLIRFYGVEEGERILANTDAVYISHLHADHHIGLIGLLHGRRKALDRLGIHKGPLYLFAPKQILTWLHFYDSCFENICEEYTLVPNSDLLLDRETLLDTTRYLILEQLGLTSINTCFVRHCPNAFGVAFTLKSGDKIVYSGDTMPSESLVELGKNCDVLVHEATMEDELSKEAIVKMHSTTSQAIIVGREMNAKHVILTHFSQRYARLPKFNDNFAANVSIAFDNMQIRIDELGLVPLFYPALKLMFAEHYEEMENKTVKRQLRLEREASLDRKNKQNIPVTSS